jgi:hypothetical protein
MLPLIIGVLTLAAGAGGFYVARKTDEKAKTEAEAIRICMQMAREGKIDPQFCSKFRDPSIAQSIADVTENISKLFITGGALYIGSHLLKAFKGGRH